MQIRWHSHVHLGRGHLGCRAIFDHDWNIQWSVRHGRFPELALGSLEASTANSNHRHLPDPSPVRFRRSQWHHFAQRLSQCNHEPPVTFCSHSNADFYQLNEDHGRIRQRNVRISSKLSRNHLNILPIFSFMKVLLSVLVVVVIGINFFFVGSTVATALPDAHWAVYAGIGVAGALYMCLVIYVSIHLVVSLGLSCCIRLPVSINLRSPLLNVSVVLLFRCVYLCKCSSDCRTIHLCPSFGNISKPWRRIWSALRTMKRKPSSLHPLKIGYWMIRLSPDGYQQLIETVTCLLCGEFIRLPFTNNFFTIRVLFPPYSIAFSHNNIFVAGYFAYGQAWSVP